MKFVGLVWLMLVVTYVSGIKDLMNTDIQKCINCLCHARSGCYSRFNCAKYSVSIDYWRESGSPSIDQNETDDDVNYKACMRNENCIVNTIAQYTDKNLDCNCDGIFDCKDRFAIHLNGSNCANPNFGHRYASRFNECSKNTGVSEMLSSEGYVGCTAPELESP